MRWACQVSVAVIEPATTVAKWGMKPKTVHNHPILEPKLREGNSSEVVEAMAEVAVVAEVLQAVVAEVLQAEVDEAMAMLTTTEPATDVVAEII
jgi:hypothetical protein